MFLFLSGSLEGDEQFSVKRKLGSASSSKKPSWSWRRQKHTVTISVLSLRLAGPLYEASVQSVSIIRQLLLLYVPVVLVAVCGRESSSLCLMISHSHIPVIADLYSLMCSAGPHSHLARPVHSTPTLRQPRAPARSFFSPSSLCFSSDHPFLCPWCSLSLSWITLLSSEIYEISISHLSSVAAVQSLKHLLCDRGSNNLSLFGPPAGSRMYIMNLVILCTNSKMIFHICHIRSKAPQWYQYIPSR